MYDPRGRSGIFGPTNHDRNHRGQTVSYNCNDNMYFDSSKHGYKYLPTGRMGNEPRAASSYCTNWRSLLNAMRGRMTRRIWGYRFVWRSWGFSKDGFGSATIRGRFYRSGSLEWYSGRLQGCSLTINTQSGMLSQIPSRAYVDTFYENIFY
ncbi:uncharacterized protein EV422DRAFT_165055 [Fimicolochytrium jonesii]|uniref:uncharacterized protein n=1 Tax=Fimicolochytrium jonesii TaxID=1396493 RepID=UPI0022FF0967|nr:uncharacterized protein EV422DRAFT_165055 [Fimicolochytrium jonesii]KAI8818788.1 hypothetical protein EV422DRAFT_165055 [Fimicolochytrium jonesii]